MSEPKPEPVVYSGTWSCEAGGGKCKVTMGPPPPTSTPLSAKEAPLLLTSGNSYNSENSEKASVPSETEILVQKIIGELGVKETEQNKYNIIREILMDITKQIKDKITLDTENQVKSMIEPIISEINESTSLEDINPQLQKAITVQLGYNTSDQLREVLRVLLSRINKTPASTENSAFVNAAQKLVAAKRAFANNPPTPNTQKALTNASVAAEAAAAEAAARAAAAAKKDEEDVAKREKRARNKINAVTNPNVSVGRLFGNNDNQNSSQSSPKVSTEVEDTAITLFGPKASRSSINVPSGPPLIPYENTGISVLFNSLSTPNKEKFKIIPEQSKRDLLGALIKLPVKDRQNNVIKFFNLPPAQQQSIINTLRANPSISMNRLLAIKPQGGGRKRTRRGKRGGRGTRRGMRR